VAEIKSVYGVDVRWEHTYCKENTQALVIASKETGLEANA
jgi:hypothetical protein